MGTEVIHVDYGLFLITDNLLIKDQLDWHDDWFRCYKGKTFFIFATTDLQDDLALHGIPKQIKNFVRCHHPETDF